MYSLVVHIYICFVTTELLCRQRRVPKSQVHLANRATYLRDNRGPVNQERVFFFVFHFELTPFSDGQLSKVSTQSIVSSDKHMKV